MTGRGRKLIHPCGHTETESVVLDNPLGLESKKIVD